MKTVPWKKRYKHSIIGGYYERNNKNPFVAVGLWILLFNSMVFSAVSEEALPVETETASDMDAVIARKYEAGDVIVEWREEGRSITISEMGSIKQL